MPTSSSPAVPLVVGLDDELLDATYLLPVAAVAAIANAGDWYLLRYDPRARELRLNPSPGPDRTPQIVCRFRHQVQRKASPRSSGRPRWAPVDAASAHQFAALEALALHGPATPRGRLRRGHPDPRPRRRATRLYRRTVHLQPSHPGKGPAHDNRDGHPCSAPSRGSRHLRVHPLRHPPHHQALPPAPNPVSGLQGRARRPGTHPTRAHGHPRAST